METFKVSTSVVPGGWPPLVQARIHQLGPGATASRADIGRVCGTPSAANHFIDQATNEGLLVPVSWGSYCVADAETIAIMARIPHRTFRRFTAWARILTPPGVLFAGPRMWRDTHLNVEHPMPVLPIPRDRIVVGAPPQWNAFHMDVTGTETWQLVVDKTPVATFEAPSVLDVTLLAWATRDGRWMEAADQLRERFTKKQVAAWEQLVARAQPPDLAPRGRAQRATIKLGPPYRHAILSPPWYFELARQTLRPGGTAE